MERRNTMVRAPTDFFPESSLNLSDTPDDLDMVLERSRLAGVKSMIITGGSLHESKEALQLSQKYGSFSAQRPLSKEVITGATGFYATIGCHPTRSGQFDKFKGGPSAYLDALDALIEKHLQGKGRVVAVGECGLGATFEMFLSLV